MPRVKKTARMTILHSFVVKKNPTINKNDADACARAYGQLWKGTDFIAVSGSKILPGPHGKIISTTIEFWQGEDDAPTTPAVDVPAGSEKTGA